MLNYVAMLAAGSFPTRTPADSVIWYRRTWLPETSVVLSNIDRNRAITNDNGLKLTRRLLVSIALVVVAVCQRPGSFDGQTGVAALVRSTRGTP